jgi:hypothetical protein
MNIGSFGFQGGNGSGGIPPNTNFGLFSQISNSNPVANTIDEKTLLGIGIGTLVVPENTFIQGDSFHLKMCGVLNAKNNAQLTIRLHSNGIDIGTTGLLTLGTTTAKVWELLVDFTIREVGGLGSAELLTNGVFLYDQDSSSSFEGITFLDLNNTTFDTLVNNTLDVVAQWSSADPLNSIYSAQTILTKTF